MDFAQDDEDGSSQHPVAVVREIKCCIWKLLLWKLSHKVRATSCGMLQSVTAPNRSKSVAVAVLGPQKTVQKVTPSTEEIVNFQHKTVPRALLHQQEEINYRWSDQHGAVERQNLVSASAMQVRHLEQEADARFSQRQRDLLLQLGNGSDCGSMEARCAIFRLPQSLNTTRGRRFA